MSAAQCRWNFPLPQGSVQQLQGCEVQVIQSTLGPATLEPGISGSRMHGEIPSTQDYLWVSLRCHYENAGSMGRNGLNLFFASHAELRKNPKSAFDTPGKCKASKS